MTESGQNSRPTIALLTSGAIVLGVILGIGFLDREREHNVGEGAPASVEIETNGAPVYRFFDPSGLDVSEDEFGQVEPAALGENFSEGSGPMSGDTVVIDLPGDGSVEYKAIMRQGDSLVYSWEADGGQVYYDFHAHQKTDTRGFFTRYSEGEGTKHGGSIVAAYDGQHGWFWLNLEAGPVRITLNVAGYYSEIVEIAVD